ncbi:NAD(P)H-quinone oxidoreductase [Alteromonas halophila]|uniref:NAD(P)H quinone oxidoreductase n=1 Tax=Alteromonas halophila TaxID=516698 RepID=A0A918MWM9_9ALTE|nr:NAD(P)H-quinone oxidoreductase [Alteromonas halophila]GGW76713.1 NAD(P)H quinone oxidoreductase [Alteromonas halophila]
MKFIDFTEGGPDTLRIANTSAPQAGAGQVLIEVAAFGINRADTLQRQGKYPPPPGESEILGLEVAGTVIDAGKDVSRWQTGDKVFGLVAGGGYAQQAVVNAQHLMAVPEGMPLEQAAGLAEVFLTAYQCVHYIAGLEQGQRALIHAGASGVGLAALQLCRYMGITTATTASSTEKLSLCKEMGADIAINYKQDDFATMLKDAWPEGVDMVLDMVGGDYLNRNLQVLRRDGHIVQLAMLAGRYADNLDLALLLGKRARIQGTTLRSRTDSYKRDLIDAFSARCLDGFVTGKLVVNMDTVYDVTEIQTAHQRLEENSTKGKVVVRW